MAIPEIQPGSTQSERLYFEKGVIIVRGTFTEAVFSQLSLLSAAVFAIMDLKSHEMLGGEARDDDPLVAHIKLFDRLQFVGDDVV
jgi:hypothetical protein